MAKWAPLFVVLAGMLWGIDGIVLRPALYNFPVALIVCLESWLIVLLLHPLIIRNRHRFKTLSRGDWLAFAGVALCGGAIGTMAITQALFYVNFVNLSIVILIQKLQPAIAILLAALLLKERPGKSFYGWSLIAIIGAYFMTFGFQPVNIANNSKTTEAALFALLAVAGFGASTVFSKRALKNVEFEFGTVMRFLLTGIIMLPLAVFLGDLGKVDTLGSGEWKTLGLIAITTGGPGIFLYYYGLKRISASVATICELAFPMTAVLLEYFLRGNLLTMPQWIGTFILFGAMARVSQLPQKNDPQTAAAAVDP